MTLAGLLGWHYDWLAAAWGDWLWVTFSNEGNAVVAEVARWLAQL